MGLMAGAAACCRRLMHKTIPPVFSDPGMAAQAQSGLSQFEITAVDRAMTVVAGGAITILYRLMTHSNILAFSGDIAMTIETDRTRCSFNQIRLVAAVGTMTEQTVTSGKGGMRGSFILHRVQLLMTAKAQGTVCHGGIKQPIIAAAMGGMTTGTAAAGKGAMLTVKPQITTGTAVAGEAQILLFGIQ